MDSNSNTSTVKNKSNLYLSNLKSDYFLQKLYDNILKRQKLEIVKYNKNLQNRLNINIKDYKEYCEKFSSIEIEIVPAKDKDGHFINVNKNDEIYYHIYFNDNKKEIKNKYYINEDDKTTKIKIKIDYQVKSFAGLFELCECIEYINFKKFYRNNIKNMKRMFYKCSSLKEINLSNFNTNNVTNMSKMFFGCSSLKELNLSNFNTDNVTNMRWMFSGCSDDLKRKIKSENRNIKEGAFMLYSDESDDDY
jgi:surface protein